jgi:hypothetical protein
MCIIMNIKTQKITIIFKKLLFFSLNILFKGDHSTWNATYNMHEIYMYIYMDT